MHGEVRVEICDPGGRKHRAVMVHEGGGLVTVAVDAGAQKRFEIGARVRWLDASAPRSPARCGTIASTYASGGSINLVLSPDFGRDVAVQPRPARGPTDRSEGAASHRRSSGRPRATIITRGQAAVGDIQSVEGETVAVYVDASAVPLLSPNAEVKLWIELPGRRALHFWARLRELRVLHRGALCRLDLDSSVPVFAEQLAILERTFERAAARRSPYPAQASSLTSK